MRSSVAGRALRSSRKNALSAHRCSGQRVAACRALAPFGTVGCPKRDRRSENANLSWSKTGGPRAMISDLGERALNGTVREFGGLNST